MTFVNLNPSSTVSNTGAVTGSSAHAALSDSSDASYVKFDMGEAGRFGLSDLSLPSGAVIVLAQVFVRCAKDGDAPTEIVASLLADSSKSGTIRVAWATPSEASTAVISDGLTDAGLDAAELVLSAWLTWGTIVYKAWVRVLYLTKPTVTVDAPSGTVAVNRPVVRWSPSYDVHASGVPFRRVKVFNSTQYGAGGFDPESSTPVWDSGVAQTASEEVTSGFLPDATYRAYVKVAAGNSPDQWSDWAYGGFVVDAPQPGTPTLSATGDNANGRIEIVVDDTAGSDGVTTTKFQIQRWDGVSSAWENLRTEDGDGMVDTSGSPVTVYDYETGNDVTWTYRAQAYGASSGTWSAWSTTDTAKWTSNDEWLKCVLDPSLNLKLTVKSYPGFDVPANQGVHRALGSSKAIVTSDVPGPMSGQIVVFTKTEQNREDLSELLASGFPVLLQVPGTPDRVVSFGDRSASRVVDTAGELWHEETLPWTEVETPDGPLVS